jgi:hypothetical protein
MEAQRPELIKITNTEDQLITSIKAIKTSIELMRDEVEELHQLIIELLKEQAKIRKII